MKALTVWQPWASMIALGFKPYEFRSRQCPQAYVGKRIAIHAGGRAVRPAEIEDLIRRLRSPEAWMTGLRPGALPMLEKVLRDPTILPISHVVATAVLGKPVRAWEILEELGGAVNDSDRDQHANFAWPMLEVEELRPPVAARGAQGFWNWTGGEHG